LAAASAALEPGGLGREMAAVPMPMALSAVRREREFFIFE